MKRALWTRRVGFGQLRGVVLYLVITSGLIAASWYYAQHRQLEARLGGDQERRALLAQRALEIEAKEAEVEEARKQVQAMENDPLEIEATIREVSQGARPGEIVYHLSGFPEEPAAAGAQGINWQHTN